jgi:hypothetical protein
MSLSVRMIQLENPWTDFDEILYGLMEFTIFNFLKLVITIRQTHGLVSGWHCRHVVWGPEVMHVT